MTAVQQKLPVIATTRDRTAMLTLLSEELTERLSKHPIPPRIIVPLEAAPSRWRWLVWLGVPTIVGLAAATITIGLPDFPWTQRLDLTRSPPGDVAVVSVPTGAVAATPAVPEQVISIVATPTLASTEAAPQATSAPPAPTVHLNDRELTWTEVHELQARLRALKFDPGPLDGIRGPMTSAAVRRFQESRGAPATGAIDLAVLGQVREASGSGD